MRRFTMIGRRSIGRSLALLVGDLQDPPIQSRRRVVALDIVAPDHVENDIGASAFGCA
jgi:hypothetical protein